MIITVVRKCIRFTAKSLLLGEIQLGTEVALICFARMCTRLRSMSLTCYERRS